MVVVAGAVTLTGTAGPALADRGHDRDKDNAFTQTNLVSDLADLELPVTDPLLKNPWGVAFGPATPLWTSNQSSNSSTLYRGTRRHRGEGAARRGCLVADRHCLQPDNGLRGHHQHGTTAPARFIFAE